METENLAGWLRVGVIPIWLNHATADELLFGQMIFFCDDCGMYHIEQETTWGDVNFVIQRMQKRGNLLRRWLVF